MPDSIVRSVIREVEPLGADDLIGDAARRVLDSELPGLPAVERDGRFAGIFGEREFMTALFPGYVGELASGAMIKRSIDDAIDRRESCRLEPIRKYLTTDHVTVEDDYSDTQLAEIFLHHRVLVVPIATAGRVHAVVTRNDYFGELVKKFEDAGSPEQPRP
jgi:CBS domain-containing protein